jgi:hypothetical protein
MNCSPTAAWKTEELDISCEDGVFYLEGILPGKASH